MADMVLKTNSAFETSKFMNVVHTKYVYINLKAGTFLLVVNYYSFLLEILQTKILNN
jgi:Lhr-like helicase